jgi:hypothetical protein
MVKEPKLGVRETLVGSVEAEGSVSAHVAERQEPPAFQTAVAADMPSPQPGQVETLTRAGPLDTPPAEGEASSMVDQAPSELITTISDLKEAVIRFDERTTYLGEQISRLDRSLTELRQDMKEQISELNTTISTLGNDMKALSQQTFQEFKELNKASLSKGQFWMGISLVITVILGLAAIYFSTLKP